MVTTYDMLNILKLQRQLDLCELEASIVYIVSSRSARLHSKSLSQKKKEPKHLDATVAFQLKVSLMVSSLHRRVFQKFLWVDV